jgi:hypothetical protein
MMKEKNGTYKLLVKILAGCLILFVGWFGNEVWSEQEETSRTNTQQNVSLRTLQTNIMAVEKAVVRIDSSLANDRVYRRHQDSILMDVAIKVSLMYDGR